MKYLLAILAIIGEYLIYALIGVAMNWHHGGGIIIQGLLVTAFVLTWRSITKKGNKKEEATTVERNEGEQKLISDSKCREGSLKDSSCKVEAKENRPVISSIISSRIPETGEKDDFPDVEVKENRPAISSVISSALSSRIFETWEEDDLAGVEVKGNRPAISSVVAHLKRAKLFLEDEEWNLAEEYCEKVLEENPECGLAYFYKFMVKNRFSSPLKISTEYFLDEDRDIKKALRFADEKLKQQISSILYNQKKAVYDYGIKCLDEGDYEKAKELFSKIEDFEDAKEQISSIVYTQKKSVYEYGVKCFTEGDYKKSKGCFLQIQDFEDAKNQIEQCQNKIRESEQQKQYNMAISFMRNALYLDAVEVLTRISDFKDSSDKIKECEAEIKKAEQKKIEDKYKLACTAMQNRDYSGAISIFNEVIGFQDSKAKIEECNQQIKNAEEKEKKHKRILLLALLGALLIFVAYYLIGQTYWNKDADGHWHNLQEHEAHNYSFTVVTEATSFQDGSGINTCTVCGYEQPVVIHTYDDGVVTKQQTCTEAGIMTYFCSVCGQKLKTESVAATGVHTYDNYKCKDCGLWGKGPSGGYVFYDCDADNNSGNADGLISTECGWRFLEAAPESLINGYPFGYYRTSSSGSNLTVGTKTAIGTGKTNTDALVKAMGETAYTASSGKVKDLYAAKACADYSITVDGVVYDDWFLPSKNELNLMYTNLHKDGVGSFANDYYYWSSSEYSNSYAWRQGFCYGSQLSVNRYGSNYVRPVRAF